MRSNLKEIYKNKDKIDILKTPYYRFAVNPIYQVNKFISDKDKKLTKNLISNLEDLKIEKESTYIYESNYDYATNTIYCKNAKADVFGLLHVASNDRSKDYTGIITRNEIGYGLNNGLTEVFTNEINNKCFSYPFEATIAKAFLMINPNLILYSYFNNNGEELFSINNDMKELMMRLDNFQNNYIELMSLYSERFIKKLNKFKNNEQIRLLNYIDRKIDDLEYKNSNNVYWIFRILIDIIDNSILDSEEKQELFTRLYNEFDFMFSNEEFAYLYNLNNVIERKACIKKRVR